MRVIITHANADFDALASQVCARKLYGEAICVRSQTLGLPVRRYLALHKDRADLRPIGAIDVGQVDEIILVDVRDARRLRDYEAFWGEGRRVVVYDHHPPSDHDLAADEAHIEPVGACATLLFERVQAASITLDQWEATLVLLGIYADTGNLCFDATTPRDVEAAAHLLRLGARLSVVNRYLQQRFTHAQRQLLTQMMQQCDEISVDKVEVAISTGRSPKFVKSAAQVVDDIMRLGGHDAIFGVIGFDKGERVQVVGRSRVPYIDVGKLLRLLGGGGHAGAAAATFKGRTIESVVAEIKEALRAAQFCPTRVADLMSTPVQTIERGISLAEARRLLGRWNYSGAPVLKAASSGANRGADRGTDHAIEGIISRRDIRRAEQEARLALPVSSHMSHEVVAVAADEPIEDALELMTRRDVGRLPVLDGARLVGIITRSDILRRIYMP